MNVLIPLALALILINHQKIRDDPYYRFSMLSIVGITYFFIFRYIDYYFSIFSPGDIWHSITKVVAVLIAVGMCLSPGMTKSTAVKTGVCVFLFAVSILAAFGFDRLIKVAITDLGGYFDGPPKVGTQRYVGEAVRYTSKAGGYSLSIPSRWERRRHESQADYFVVQNEEATLAELRPRCFHKTGVVIAEVIKNLEADALIENRLTESHCFKQKDAHVCLVKSIASAQISPLERWRWLVMNPATQQNIDIDVLIYIDNAAIKDEVNFVFSSLKIESLPTPAPICLSTMDWF
ncbi:hypothetical protein ACSV5M_08735 [Cellvibrio sp. ARAG 10.3]|uniref:hypothetical protein n=1 Tax=Cellvibrio sp. ARAG 10.3 TaxID=3451358 RepID=UPI003F475DC4